jgi:hypothetical protein
MNHKKGVGILLALSGILFVVGILIMLPCDPQRNFVCEGEFSEMLGQPLLFGSIPLTFVFFLLVALPQPYFKNWLKYAAWFIPVAILWIVTSDVTCSGGLGLGLCFDKELATWWSSGIYIALSLIVLIGTYFTHRRRSYTAGL